MSEELSTQKEVQSFIDAARRYCQLFETAGKYAPTELLSQLATALANLFAAAWRLPEVQPSDSDVVGLAWADLPDLPNFGDFNIYWEVYDPYERKDALQISLSDSLKDVYQDVKSGLLALEGPTASHLNDVVWEWRFGLTTHWGNHAVSALRALHWALTKV